MSLTVKCPTKACSIHGSQRDGVYSGMSPRRRPGWTHMGPRPRPRCCCKRTASTRFRSSAHPSTVPATSTAYEGCLCRRVDTPNTCWVPIATHTFWRQRTPRLVSVHTVFERMPASVRCQHAMYTHRQLRVRACHVHSPATTASTENH